MFPGKLLKQLKAVDYYVMQMHLQIKYGYKHPFVVTGLFERIFFYNYSFMIVSFVGKSISLFWCVVCFATSFPVISNIQYGWKIC